MNRAQTKSAARHIIERAKTELNAPHPLSGSGANDAPSQPTESEVLTWADENGFSVHGFLLGMDTLGTKNCVLRVGPKTKDYGS